MVSAVFLLVVLSLLGAMMVNFSTAQHVGSAQDVQGANAYQAARAGVEWGLYQILALPAPGCASPAPLFSPAGPEALGGSLAGFTVNVSCVAAGPFAEAGATTQVYTITSTATSGGAPGSLGYVERQIQVTVER